jgi:hypothetical protein
MRGILDVRRVASVIKSTMALFLAFIGVCLAGPTFAVTVTTTSLPAGTVGAAYSATLAASSGTTPYKWTLSAGSLPAGLALSTAGAITGTPTTAATSSFTVKVTDSAKRTATATKALSIVVSAPTPAVAVSPARVGVVAAQSVTFNSTTSDPSGVTWSASGSTCSGTACGSFSATSSASGVAVTYTAPSVAGTYTVTATGNSLTTKSASATVGVTDLAAVTTYHYDATRAGANTHEYALTPKTVSSTTFGKRFSCTVDGAIYAQPLWVANLSVGGVTRNVVFVATQHDSVYAFDADTNTSPCSPLWKASLIDASHGGTTGEASVVSCGTGALVGNGYCDIGPEVGITGTPVIDASTNTMYVVTKSAIAATSTVFQRLHAIDLTTGAEKFGGPAAISGSYPGTGSGGSVVTFDPRQQHQRPGLALSNGIVYVAWASHEDKAPYFGWVMSFNASTLAPLKVFNTTPNVGYGGIWMGGGAPSVDANTGDLFVITGNGVFDATNATPPNNDLGDSLLQLGSDLTLLGYFTPSDQATDNSTDADFGSGGTAILADLPVNGSNPTHLIIGGGKDGYLYLLNRDVLTGLGDGFAWERFSFGNAIFGTAAYWNSSIYLAGSGGPLQAFALSGTTAKIATTRTSASSATFGFPGSTPSVSSAGASTNGIVWALDNSKYCTKQSPGCAAAVLHAYDATNLATELWNSTQGTGNAPGYAVKFTVPTVVNGKVYVGTRGNNNGTSGTISGELDVYGLLP